MPTGQHSKARLKNKWTNKQEQKEDLEKDQIVLSKMKLIATET
jgi:hypothetical protein